MRSKRKIQKGEFKKFSAFKKVDCQKDLQVKHFSWLRAIQGPPMSDTHSYLRTVSGGRNHLAQAFCTLKGDCVDGLSLKFVRPRRWDVSSPLPRESRAIRYHIFLLHNSLTWLRHFRQVKIHSFLPNIHSALISGWL